MQLTGTRYFVTMLGLAVSVLALSASGSAQADLPPIPSTGDAASVQQIQALIEEYKRAVDNLDVDLARKIWSAGQEVSFIHPRGTERGREQVVSNFYGVTMGTFSKRELRPDKADVHVYGDTAWSEFTWTFHATVKNGGPDITTRGRETQIYHKENGSWRIVHVHYSGMPLSGPMRGF